MKLKLLSFVLIGLFAACPSVKAGPLSGVLVPGTQNQLEDEDREHVYDVNGNGIVDTGDVLVGYLRINDRSVPQPGVPLGNQVYAIFSQTIVTTVPGGFGVTGVVLAPTPSVSPHSLQSILGVSTAVLPEGTIFAVYDKAGGFATDFLNNPQGPPIETNLQAIASQGTLEVAGGFSATHPSDFFSAVITDNRATTIAGINTIPLNNLVGSDAGGLSILVNNTGFDFATAINVQNPLTQTSDNYQLGASGKISGAVGDAAYAKYGNPGFQTNTNFNVFPTTAAVPEPASFCLAITALVGLAGGNMLRRRKS
ncbi:MAG: hypothetical protein ACJ8FY_26210 [Gemmataceae bacterium]